MLKFTERDMIQHENQDKIFIMVCNIYSENRLKVFNRKNIQLIISLTELSRLSRKKSYLLYELVFFLTSLLHIVISALG